MSSRILPFQNLHNNFLNGFLVLCPNWVNIRYLSAVDSFHLLVSVTARHKKGRSRYGHSPNSKIPKISLPFLKLQVLQIKTAAGQEDQLNLTLAFQAIQGKGLLLAGAIGSRKLQDIIGGHTGLVGKV